MAQSLSLTSIRRRAAYNAQSETLTAAASQACSIAKKITYCTPDGTDVVTVADGQWIGQEKIVYNVGGANTPIVTLTPATTPGAYTTITLDDQEGCLLVWTATGWIPILGVGAVKA